MIAATHLFGSTQPIARTSSTIEPVPVDLAMPLAVSIPFFDCGPWWTSPTPWFLIVGSFGIGIAFGALVL